MNERNEAVHGLTELPRAHYLTSNEIVVNTNTNLVLNKRKIKAEIKQLKILIKAEERNHPNMEIFKSESREVLLKLKTRLAILQNLRQFEVKR